MSKINDENQIDLLDHIKRLEAKLDALTPKAPEPVVPIDYTEKWPKTFDVYLHADRESMYEFGMKHGLHSDALRLFRHALTEVTVTLSVNEDGTYKVTNHTLENA